MVYSLIHIMGLNFDYWMFLLKDPEGLVFNTIDIIILRIMEFYSFCLLFNK